MWGGGVVEVDVRGEVGRVQVGGVFLGCEGVFVGWVVVWWVGFEVWGVWGGGSWM